MINYTRRIFPTPILLITLVLATSSCVPTNEIRCIDPSKISEGPCIMEYNPVCGCDGKTYANPCQAERARLVSWEQGNCDPK